MTTGPGVGAAPRTDLEVEWQFDAYDLRPVERWLASLPARALSLHSGCTETAAEASGPETTEPEAPALTVLARPPRRIVDRYLDTSDWRLAKAGFVLRARRQGRHDEVTMKDLAEGGPSGLRRRLEVTEPLPEAGLEALGNDGPVGRRLRAILGRRTLVELLEIRTRRRPFSLRVGDAEVAEVALDDTTILPARGTAERPVRLRRVEVEAEAARVEALRRLVDDLVAQSGLRPAAGSKFEAGLLGLGIPKPEPPDFGPLDVAPTASLEELALAIVRRQLLALVRHEPGTRLGEDPEELHDMRVATRRLRAALSLFADALAPEAAAARAELGWLGRTLGAVRDLDVQLGHHGAEVVALADLLGAERAQGALEPLAALLLAERDRAREQLLETLDSSRYEALVASLIDLVRPRRAESAGPPATTSLAELVARRHQSAAKAARRARRSGQPGDFHRLRIRCKRLRYCLECTIPVYGEAATRFARRLARLQDVLGELQDGEAKLARLVKLADEHGSTLPPGTLFAMGALAGRQRAATTSLLKRAKRTLAALEKRRWHALVRVMEGRRLEALSTPVLAPPEAPAAEDPTPASAPDGGGGDGSPPSAEGPPNAPGDASAL